MTIYMLPFRGLSTMAKELMAKELMAKELMAASRIMQSSSNELGTLVSGKEKCKQAKTDA